MSEDYGRVVKALTYTGYSIRKGTVEGHIAFHIKRSGREGYITSTDNQEQPFLLVTAEAFKVSGFGSLFEIDGVHSQLLLGAKEFFNGNFLESKICWQRAKYNFNELQILGD